MAPMKFDTTVSLGNLMSIATVIVGLTAGYVTLQTRAEEQGRRIDALEERARERGTLNDRRFEVMESRVRAVEVLQASQSSDLRNIQAGIGRIEAQLERLAGK